MLMSSNMTNKQGEQFGTPREQSSIHSRTEMVPAKQQSTTLRMVESQIEL